MGDSREPSESPDFRSQTEHQVPAFTLFSLSYRNSRFPESPGIIDSRTHPELRFPGFTKNSGLPESQRTPRSRNWESGTPRSRNHQENRVPGVSRISGFPESPGNLCSRSNPELRVAGDNSGFPVSTGTAGIHPELRVPQVKRNSGYLESTGTPRSRNHQELRVPESIGTPGYWSHPEL